MYKLRNNSYLDNELHQLCIHHHSSTALSVVVRSLAEQRNSEWDISWHGYPIKEFICDSQQHLLDVCKELVEQNPNIIAYRMYGCHGDKPAWLSIPSIPFAYDIDELMAIADATIASLPTNALLVL